MKMIIFNLKSENNDSLFYNILLCINYFLLMKENISGGKEMYYNIIICITILWFVTKINEGNLKKNQKLFPEQYVGIL